MNHPFCATIRAMNAFIPLSRVFPSKRRFAFGTVAGAAAVLGALLLLGGCGSGGGTSPAPNPTPTPIPTPDTSVTTTRQFPGGNLSLTIPKRVYVVGEVVPMTITVQNTGTESLSDASTIPYYTNCTVRATDDRYGGIIDSFDESTGESTKSRQWEPAPPLYPRSIAVGETRTFSLRWNQTYRPDLGKQVPPGTYYLRAQVGFHYTDYWNGISFSDVPLTDALAIEVQ